MKNQLLQFFKYDHLPVEIQEPSKILAHAAIELEAILPSNSEKTVAMRKLLEAKDCAVRALLYKETP